MELSKHFLFLNIWTNDAFDSPSFNVIIFLRRREGRRVALHLLKKKREAALAPISEGRIKVNKFLKWSKNSVSSYFWKEKHDIIVFFG